MFPHFDGLFSKYKNDLHKNFGLDFISFSLRLVLMMRIFVKFFGFLIVSSYYVFTKKR